MFGQRNDVEDGGEALALVGAVQGSHQDNFALLSRVFAEFHQVGEKLPLVDADDVVFVEFAAEADQRPGLGRFQTLEQNIQVTIRGLFSRHPFQKGLKVPESMVTI